MLSVTGAKVHRKTDGQFYVGYTLRGEECDEAGPFEDEIDALLAAKRAGTDALEIMVGYSAPLAMAETIDANREDY